MNGGEAPALQIGQELAAKLAVLAKMRAKRDKHVAKPTKPAHSAVAAASSANDTARESSVVPGGSLTGQRPEPRQQSPPQWRVERDAQKKKKRKRPHGSP